MVTKRAEDDSNEEGGEPDEIVGAAFTSRVIWRHTQQDLSSLLMEVPLIRRNKSSKVRFSSLSLIRLFFEGCFAVVFE